MRKDPICEGREAAQPTSAPILCVDGSRSSLDRLSLGLRRAGFATVTAEDARTAIALCAQTRPALAIVDCLVPDGSGIEVARRLQDFGSLPVIVVASNPDATLVSQAADAGAVCVLHKPVEMTHVVPAARTALSRHVEVERLRERLQRLESARQKRHETGIVVGLLMERLQIPSQEAFARLRRFARERSRKISEVASEILTGSENLFRTTRQISDAGGASHKGI